jgi:cysteinyl-tRNA synthetase
MIQDVLGLPIDIHGGGIDLVFPHHENELAQGVCAGHGREYAKIWLHNGFLNMADEKMSKSVGNVVLAHDLLKTWPGEVLRWALLSGHYRQPLEWTEALLDQAKSALDRLYRVLDDSGRFLAGRTAAGGDGGEIVRDALLDDLNTPQAFAGLFQLADRARQAVMAKDAPAATAARAALLDAGGLMGFLTADPQAWFQAGADDDLKGRVEALMAERAAARAAKNWPEADRIRDALAALNVEVMDGPSGATWRVRENA